MKILLTIALMFVMMISKAQTNSFSESYLSFDNGQTNLSSINAVTNVGNTSLNFVNAITSYNLIGSAYQRWSLVNSHLQNIPSPGIIVYVASNNGVLTVTQNSNNALSWTFNNNLLSTVVSGSTQYLAKSPSGQAILSPTQTTLNLTAANSPIQINQVYTFTCTDFPFALQSGSKNPANFVAKTVPAPAGPNDSIGSPFYIFGLIIRSGESRGIQYSQLKALDSLLYMSGNMNCMPLPDPNYNWYIIDNGDGTATLECYYSNGVDNIPGILTCTSTGGLQLLSPAPSGKGPGQKWKYKKRLAAIIPD